MAEKIAVYPGTFDPMTLGHFDLIKRAAKLYDRLIVAVAATSAKQGAKFSADDRLAMIREDVRKAKIRNVDVKILDGLLVDFCRREKAKVVIRGVRVYSDFEYEFQMALTNRRMAPEIETLFMMPSESLAYVTASTVREIASYDNAAEPLSDDEKMAQPVLTALQNRTGTNATAIKKAEGKFYFAEAREDE